MIMNKSNFHFHSHCIFNALPKSWAKIAFQNARSLQPMVLGNRTWFPLAKSGSIYSSYDMKYLKYVYHPTDTDGWKFHMGSSTYWVSADNSHLLRLSDHWSSDEGPIDVRTCGNIKNCYWKIRTRSKKPLGGFCGFVLGVVAFSDMHNRLVS